MDLHAGQLAAADRAAIASYAAGRRSNTRAARHGGVDEYGAADHTAIAAYAARISQPRAERMPLADVTPSPKAASVATVSTAPSEHEDDAFEPGAAPDHAESSQRSAGELPPIVLNPAYLPVDAYHGVLYRSFQL